MKSSLNKRSDKYSIHVQNKHVQVFNITTNAHTTYKLRLSKWKLNRRSENACIYPSKKLIRRNILITCPNKSSSDKAYKL